MKQVTKSNKNSLIELMRFLFALWVLYYHSFVPYKNEFWSNGFLAVEFFFVLSGFYLVRSIDRYAALPLKEGLPKFLLHRFKPIAVLFIINDLFSIYYSFAIELSYNVFFGYLWYIRDLFIAITLFFLLRKYIRSQKLFYCVISILSFAAFFAFQLIPMLAWPGGPFRSVAAMPIGMLAALIPKISVTKSNKSSVSHILLIVAGITVSSIGCLTIAVLAEKSQLLKYALVIIIFPALLYFASCANVKCALLNWLGSLSFPIYAFQCILRIIDYYWIRNETVLFVILVSLVLVYSLIENLVIWKKRKALS